MRQVSAEDIVNGWLKYHNTTVKEVIEKHPKELLQSPDWFKLYEVTQEQYDEWEKWAKEYIRKKTKISKKYIDRKFGFIALEYGPNIKK